MIDEGGNLTVLTVFAERALLGLYYYVATIVLDDR
jgi:hypothetical protein